ncbi:MAG: FHA domain-containing protein [Deltaproteobacteria bacterium]|nr:FHA domain-containing protein [Deltaproteobacteria bacterium]
MSKTELKKKKLSRAEDETIEGEAFVDEDPTVEFDLRAVGQELAEKRKQSMQGVLTVRRSAGNEVEIPIDRQELTIGRDNSCDIVLHDEAVSRRHAAIRRQEGGYFVVQDLGSRNGTLVGGLPIKDMLITEGDRFTVGTVRCTLSLREG